MKTDEMVSKVMVLGRKVAFCGFLAVVAISMMSMTECDKKDGDGDAAGGDTVEVADASSAVDPVEASTAELVEAANDSEEEDVQPLLVDGTLELQRLILVDANGNQRARLETLPDRRGAGRNACPVRQLHARSARTGKSAAILGKPVHARGHTVPIDFGSGNRPAIPGGLRPLALVS